MIHLDSRLLSRPRRPVGRFDTELPGVLADQSLPAAELHRTRSFRMLRTSRGELALAAALFSACWTTVLLLPNPLMPTSVARSHFWETLGFNLVYGALAGWLLCRLRHDEIEFNPRHSERSRPKVVLPRSLLRTRRPADVRNPSSLSFTSLLFGTAFGAHLADAALLRVAEREGLGKIFTADRRDFSVYRLHGRIRPALLP
jgi:hypothetical protein